MSDTSDQRSVVKKVTGYREVVNIEGGGAHPGSHPASSPNYGELNVGFYIAINN